MITSIAPSSQIYLLSGVEINPGNELYFSNLTAQQNYFTSKISKSFDNQRYVKTASGNLRIEENAENLYNCNFIMYKNTGYGNKYFYGIIKEIIYINDNTSEIEYEIDSYQSFMFDVTFRQSFIERCHQTTDVIGDNLIDEGIPTGDFKTAYTIDTPSNKSLCIIMQTTIDVPLFISSGLTSIYDVPASDITNKAGIMDGLGYYVFLIQDSNGVDCSGYFAACLRGLIVGGVSDRIVNMWEYPAFFFTSSGSPLQSGHIYRLGELDTPIFRQVTPGCYRPTTLDGYTPKNNKMLTFPYCQLYLTNSGGANKSLNFDYFANPASISFYIYGTTSPEAKIRITPASYKNSTGDFDEGLDSLCFPTVSWINDSYSIWLTQNRSTFAQNVDNMGVSYAQSMVSGTIGAVTSAVSGKVPLSGALGLVNTSISANQSVNSLLASLKDKSIAPDGAQNICSTGLNIQNGRIGFRVMGKTVTSYNAKIIDDYFTKYGYAQKKIDNINLHARQRFTYVKTLGCNVTGGAPFSHLRKIEEMINAGCTFWADTSKVFDYSDNPLL